MRALRILAWGVALATLAALTAGLLQILEILPSDQEDWIPLAIYPFLALAILSPAVVGLLIALQLPRNRIAWILMLGALLPALQIASEQLVGAAWAYQTEGATVPPVLFAWPLAVAFVFPDGRLLSGRWHWVVGMAIVSFSFTIGLKLFDPEPYPAPNEDLPNPLLGNAVGELIIDTGIWIPFAVGVLASLFAGALAVILRFRRSVGVERLQMKWLVWGASLIPLVLPLDIVLSTWFGGGGAKTFCTPTRRPVRIRCGDRDRGRAVPAVRDRAPRQSHARLRDADAPAPRRLRGDHGRAGRRRRWRLRVGRGAGDARRGARVPSACARASRISSTAATAGLGTRVCVSCAHSRTTCARDAVHRRRSVPSSPRRSATRSPTLFFWLPETRGVRRRDGRDRRRAARRKSAAGDPARRRAHGACCSTTRRCSSAATCSTASSPRPRCRSRWRGCASRSGSNSPRSRRRGRASSRPATRSAAGSSATSTTAPSSGSSRSGCRSGASS